VAQEPRRRAVPKGRRWPGLPPPAAQHSASGIRHPASGIRHPAQVTASRPAEQDPCQPGCDDPLNPPPDKAAKRWWSPAVGFRRSLRTCLRRP